MLRQHHAGHDFKRSRGAHRTYRLAQHIDMPHQQVAVTLQQFYREEKRPARQEVAPIVRHARIMSRRTRPSDAPEGQRKAGCLSCDGETVGCFANPPYVSRHPAVIVEVGWVRSEATTHRRSTGISNGTDITEGDVGWSKSYDPRESTPPRLRRSILSNIYVE
jgi:hypothetical protein